MSRPSLNTAELYGREHAREVEAIYREYERSAERFGTALFDAGMVERDAIKTPELRASWHRLWLKWRGADQELNGFERVQAQWIAAGIDTHIESRADRFAEDEAARLRYAGAC